MNLQYVLLPGYGNSGPDHWQTHWEKADPAQFFRVNQNDWERPVRAEWVATLEKTVASRNSGIVLVAHSLACLLVAFWAAQTKHKVAGALLVAPPDPAAKAFPPAIQGFGDFPRQALSFPSHVVASDNDPYATPDFSERCANQWGSRFIRLSGLGHINADSRLGSWPEGQRILGALVREIGA